MYNSVGVCNLALVLFYNDLNDFDLNYSYVLNTGVTTGQSPLDNCQSSPRRLHRTSVLQLDQYSPKGFISKIWKSL